jgi:hypothetical protein
VVPVVVHVQPAGVWLALLALALLMPLAMMPRVVVAAAARETFWEM